MNEQQLRLSSLLEIPTSSPEFQVLPIRRRKMSDQASGSTSTSTSEQQASSSSSSSTYTPAAHTSSSSDSNDSTYAPTTSTSPSVSATAAEQEAWRTLYPPSPRLRDNLSAEFDPPFPDPEPEPASYYTPYTPYSTSSTTASLSTSTSTSASTSAQPEQERYANDNTYYSNDENAAAYPDPRDMWPIIACPCPCHGATATSASPRPWLAFSNAEYVACPLCWVDAYMTAHGDRTRAPDCERYLRGVGKDPTVPASLQC